MKLKKQTLDLIMSKDQNKDYQNYKDQDLNSSTSENVNKFDILLLNNGWNDNNEKFIVSIGENAASFKYMHEKTSVRYLLYDNIIKIGITITSILLSADTFIEIFQTNNVLQIFNKVVVFCLAIVSIIYNFLKYAELSTNHSYSASSFGILYHDIRNIMCLYRKDRPNAIKYIQNSIKQYDHLEVNGPKISNSTLNEFKKTFSNTNISVPDIADKIQKIDIITEPNNISSKIEINTDQKNTVFNINNQSNLSQIHDAFKIDGDLSEHDQISIKQYNNYKNSDKQTEYEMNRFMSHNVV